MRFDLEIANTNVDLMYVPEGVKIPQGAISTYYVGIDSRSAVPSNFISIEENVLNNPFSGQGAIEVTGPIFSANSEQFLLTNVAKYIMYENVRVPLFYKHVIVTPKGEASVTEDGIKIIDYDGGAVSVDDYLVEQTENYTYIYMNKTDKILFIEYTSSQASYKKLLNLQPIYEAMTWTDLASDGIPTYKYTISSDGQVSTSYTGTMYIIYQNDIGLIRKPTCNIDDAWYLSVYNTSFTVADKFTSRLYHIPEFYIQHSFTSQQYKQISHNKCKMLYANYIALQAQPAAAKISEVVVYVEDYYSGQLKYIFSTDTSKEGLLYQDNIHFGVTTDYNNDGIIALPYTITDSDIVYADYSVVDEFYEFRLVDFSTSLLTHGGYICLYMIPDANDGESSVFCAYIGKDDSRSIVEKIGTQGVGFWGMDDYLAFINTYKCYHLCTAAISASEQASMVTMYDARRIGGVLSDKKSGCEASADVFLADLISGNLVVPVRDTLITVLDTERLRLDNILKYSPLNYSFDNNAVSMFNIIQDIVSKSLDVSTNIVMQIRLDSRIPASRMISVVDGFISMNGDMSSDEVVEI